MTSSFLPINSSQRVQIHGSGGGLAAGRRGRILSSSATVWLWPLSREGATPKLSFSEATSQSHDSNHELKVDSDHEFELLCKNHHLKAE